MMLRARDRKTWANSAPSDRHTFVPYFSWEFPAKIVSLMLRFRMKSSYSLREVFAVALRISKPVLRADWRDAPQNQKL